MSFRLMFSLVFVVLLFTVAPAQAAPGALNVLVTGNQSGTQASLAAAVASEPGVASASSFDTSTATPTAESLTAYDLIVSIGDSSYSDPSLWGDRLADFVDAGGAVLQTAYDNWEDAGAAPTGRFASGGYAPLLNGNNDNLTVSLGSIVIPDHPLVQNLPPNSSTDNTTTPLAPGATLVAKWSDDRNAIAFKNRVASISASPGDSNTIPLIARLALNTGNYLGRHNVNVVKSGKGVGTVSSTANGIDCGTTCGGVFAFGTKFNFKAVPGKDSRFAGWSGACSGTGICEPTVAGADLSVGAVFAPARFGRRTNVSISLASRKTTGSGTFKVRLRNRNNFTVTGTISGRTADKLKLKSKRLSLRANRSKTLTLKLSGALRSALMQNGKLKIRLTAKLKDPSRRTRTVRKSVTVKP